MPSPLAPRRSVVLLPAWVQERTYKCRKITSDLQYLFNKKYKKPTTHFHISLSCYSLSVRPSSLGCQCRSCACRRTCGCLIRWWWPAARTWTLPLWGATTRTLSAWSAGRVGVRRRGPRLWTRASNHWHRRARTRAPSPSWTPTPTSRSTAPCAT